MASANLIHSLIEVGLYFFSILYIGSGGRVEYTLEVV